MLAREVEFLRWLHRQCEVSDRVWGGVETLWNDYSEWWDKKGGSPVSWVTFMELVNYWRVPVFSIGETLMAAGVALKADTAFYPTTSVYATVAYSPPPRPWAEEERR